MSVFHPTHSHHEHHVPETVSNSFWISVIMLIAMYVFFVALGAFDPTEAVSLTVGFAVLVGLWLVHTATVRKHRREPIDPRIQHARERRGF